MKLYIRQQILQKKTSLQANAKEVQECLKSQNGKNIIKIRLKKKLCRTEKKYGVKKLTAVKIRN